MATPAGPEPSVVLRSVDKTNFYVIKPLLRIASPVLEDMLNMGMQNELQDGLPVVNLPEASGKPQMVNFGKLPSFMTK